MFLCFSLMFCCLVLLFSWSDLFVTTAKIMTYQYAYKRNTMSFLYSGHLIAAWLGTYISCQISFIRPALGVVHVSQFTPFTEYVILHVS